MSNFDQKVRREPRLSVNKFGEYLATNKASRRERILKDAKFPPTFQVMRYEEAKRIIKQALASGNLNTQDIQKRISELSATDFKNEYDERLVKMNIEALNHFVEAIPQLAFSEYEFQLAPTSPTNLKLNDLTVSIAPDLYVSSKTKNDGQAGCLKLNIGKSYMHTIESGQYVGALMLEHGTQTASNKSDFKYTMVYDVFSKKLIAAPKATTNRIKDAIAAATEIARQWPSIE